MQSIMLFAVNKKILSKETNLFENMTMRREFLFLMHHVTGLQKVTEAADKSEGVVCIFMYMD